MTTTDRHKFRLSDAPLGKVILGVDTLQVVFVRHLRHPIEKVWAALTMPERLEDWFVAAKVDLRPGGQITFDGRGLRNPQMRIAVREPPPALAWAWTIAGRETLVRFDLASEPGGCSLTLTHSGVPLTAEGVLRGWHAHLEALPDAIEGRATRWEVKVSREEALKADYPALADYNGRHPGEGLPG
jgi:uncharacterized protein YndB with AHSA1/START domain